MQRKKKNTKNKAVEHIKLFEFSKLIIMQESLLVWISTIKLLDLATQSIINDYTGSLPYISALCSAIWAAYGVSVAFYYNKAKAENLNKQYTSQNKQTSVKSNGINTSNYSGGMNFSGGI